MKITYDPYADALYYFYNGQKIAAKTHQVSDDVLVDFDRNKKLLGIEILAASHKLPKKALKSVSFEIQTRLPKPLLK